MQLAYFLLSSSGKGWRKRRLNGKAAIGRKRLNQQRACLRHAFDFASRVGRHADPPLLHLTIPTNRPLIAEQGDTMEQERSLVLVQACS